MSTNPVSVPLEADEEYRGLKGQHQEYEQRLAELADKVVLTDEEQLEETTLKKRKLQIKDRMEQLRSQQEAQA